MIDRTHEFLNAAALAVLALAVSAALAALVAAAALLVGWGMAGALLHLTGGTTDRTLLAAVCAVVALLTLLALKYATRD